MSATHTIRLVLADDHAVVLEGLSMVLSRFDDFEIVGTANGGADAVALVADTEPDVLLIDLSMPEVDGVEAIRRILADRPRVRVLALTAFLEHQLVTAAIEAGALGYLLKSASGEEIAAAVRIVAAGGSTLTPAALPMLAGPGDQVGDDLTPRERDVLSRLAAGLSNKHIATELGLRPGTVRIHVSNILAKLHVENRTAAAVLARDHGLVADDLSGR
ncbi:response regulator [Ilumatobacter sp.]|uniref:response regulator n=1 Tax=Ilumatobacter sp. TaxID=1967498 RepID=UPI003AF58C16